MIFTINLNSVTSNQTPPYRKPNLPLISSIYSVFFPLKIQGKLKQDQIIPRFFYFVWKETTHKPLTVSWRRPLSYRNQSIDLLCKSMDWFLYDNGLRHERVKSDSSKNPFLQCLICRTCFDECILFHVVTRRHYFF